MIPLKQIAGQYFEGKGGEISPYRVLRWAYNWAITVGKEQFSNDNWKLSCNCKLTDWLSNFRPVFHSTRQNQNQSHLVRAIFLALWKSYRQLLVILIGLSFLFAPAVIGQSNYCVIVVSALIWKLFYSAKHQTMLMCLSETLQTTRYNFFFALITLPPCTYWCNKDIQKPNYRHTKIAWFTLLQVHKTLWINQQDPRITFQPRFLENGKMLS